MVFITNKIPSNWYRWLPWSNRRKQLDSRVLVALSLGGICILSLLRALWKDYSTYMTYGPGELPYSIRGWVISGIVMRPLATDVFGTDLYDNNPDKRSWMSQGWPQRNRGPRPRVGPHPIPQRQLNQDAPVDISLKLSEAFAQLVADNLSLLQFKPSIHEGHSIQSIFITGSIDPPPIAKDMLGEVCHIHATGDHSMHVVLAPQDCKKVIEMGWGQRHPLDGVDMTKYVFGWTLSKQYLLLYAPRTDEELETVMEIIKASARYMTNSKIA